MMRDTAWVLAAVGSAAAAGLAAGLMWCKTAAAAPDALDLQAADRMLVEKFVADFDLTSEQTTLLRAILHRLRGDETSIYRRNVVLLPNEVQVQLADAKRAADTRIEFMLDAKQRARYEQLRATQQQGPEQTPTGNSKR